MENITNIERAVLSTLILNYIDVSDVIFDIKSSDFYIKEHQEIFEIIVSLFTAQKPLSEEFILQKSKHNPNIEVSLTHIIATTPIVEISHYIELLQEEAKKRDINSFCKNINYISQDNNLDSQEQLQHIESSLYKLISNEIQKDFVSINSAISKTKEYISSIQHQANNLIGITTGFRKLNKITNGFAKGDLIIIAGRPSMGKTAFALNIVEKNLEEDNSVAIFSLEMSVEQLMLRLFSVHTDIELEKIRKYNLSDDEKQKLDEAMEYYSNKELFVDDSGFTNINMLKIKLKKLKIKHPNLKLVLIDYLQLISSLKNRDRHLEISEISRGLKLLARELDLPIVALSQLNRALETRSDKRPMMSDLRESGAIEQDADIIMFLYREDVYTKKDKKQDTPKPTNKAEEKTEVIIAKHRNGQTGTIELTYKKNLTKFVETKTQSKIVMEFVSYEGE